MSDSNEYENILSIDSEDLLTQTNMIEEDEIKKEIKYNYKNRSKEKNKQETNNIQKIINKQETVDNIYINNPEKYGDDTIYESWADNNIYFPLANKLVDPMKNLGLTPNMVTYIGTFCTLLAIYYISINEFHFAALSYFIGYLFDCIDGKLARKHNMTSKEGMVLDLTSDNITNTLLILYLVYRYGYYNLFTPIIFIMSLLLSLSYGLNEAIVCHKATGNDNFLLRRQNQIGITSNILDNIFLFITGRAYASYRIFFPTYDEDKINKWLGLLKEFGPGNYCLLVTFIIFNLSK